MADVASVQGWGFHPWQADTMDVAMEYHPRTRLPFYSTVAISVARQNGKTVLVLARVGAQLIIPKSTVAYTAQDRGLARIKWAEHVDVLMSTPFSRKVAYVEKTNHREMLVMRNGSRYLPFTPSKRKAARSLSLDLAVIDEAFAHESLALVGAVRGTMAARPRAQLWLLSNAGDEKSKLWRHYTDLGRLECENPGSSMCYVEYSADPDADVFDHQAWLDANPSLDLPNGVSSQALSASALDLSGDAEEIFQREHLNIWTTAAASHGIDQVAWAACVVGDLVPGDPFVLSLDFTPERDRGALVSAGVVRYSPKPGEIPPEDRTPVDVLEASSDIEGLISRAIDVATRTKCLVVIDRGGPAASAIARLEKAKVKVRMIPMTELANACGDLHDAVKHATFAHRGDFRLTDAVTSASKRPLGDKWVWKRRGGADISPLMAATMARWGAVTAPAKRKSAYADEAELTVV